METQNQIKRTLTQPEAIEHIRSVLDGNDIMHRTQLADQICEHYGFFDARGAPQKSSCLKALRELEYGGHIVLPAPLVQPGRGSPRRLSYPVAAPQAVPAEAGDVRGVQLILVQTVEQMRIWNEMMICEHPRGAVPLVGRQLRYLIGSEHGWLGAMGFGAAALQLQDRDRWIGWAVEMRRAHLHRVIGLSRFLIRPDVHCHNLASRLLGLVMRELLGDFEQRFGFRPWLVESFVDTGCFSGACFRAANWVRVGRTQGRGRQDRHREMAETVKDIYLYPLEKDFRVKLGLPADSGPGALEVADGLGADQWAEKEFGGAPLGDKRLSSRLVDCAGAKAKKPDRAFSGVAEGNWPAVKGYYRLIDHPDESAVTMEKILLPHRERTVRRMKAQCLAPSAQSKTDGRSSRAIPIEEKKIFSWIVGLRDCMELAEDMPHTRIINVMDREADFFDLFDEHRKNPRSDLLVRAQYERCTNEDVRLFEAVRQSEVRGQLRIHVNRQSARPKKSKQKARPKRLERTAEVSLRYRQIELCPPECHKDKTPIALWVVHVVEDNPPEDVEGLEWFLLTTVEIQSVEDAEMCLRWHCLRWRIEDWHRVLKSGCRIEDAAHKTAERLKRAIAINLVIAWRIMLMTLLGRETPELPAEALFSDHMDRIDADTAAIWKNILRDVAEREGLDLSSISYDGTNFYTFIDTFNLRCQIAKRGKNKQGRNNLRQVSYALFCCADGHMPLFYDVYEGNRNDAKEFPLILQRFNAFLGELCARGCGPADITMVFDKGNNSASNFTLIDGMGLHFVGSAKLDEHKDLAHISNDDVRFVPCDAAALEGTKAFRVEKAVYGKERIVVVSFNQNLFNTQWLTLQNDMHKALEQLCALRQKLQDRAAGLIQRGRAPTVQSVQKQCEGILSRQYLKQIINVQIREGPQDTAQLDYMIDSAVLNGLSDTHLGKTLIITDRAAWDDARIIQAYRSQFIIENVFKEMKDRKSGAWWPLNHWTDSKIKVHGLYCTIAL